MAEKYYAVKVGMQRGIFRTWEECRINVSGYPGAEFKSFKRKADACAYLGIEYVEDEPEDISGQKDGWKEGDCVKIYVDGSYNSASKEFSYGMVVLGENGEEKFNHKFDDGELASMHNVAGEIKGAEAAMQYGVDHHLKEIEIYHDYEGIAKWCLGTWKANKEATKAYKAFYDEISQQMKIKFIKVTSHSNNKYNDMADQLAREALGLE